MISKKIRADHGVGEYLQQQTLTFGRRAIERALQGFAGQGAIEVVVDVILNDLPRLCFADQANLNCRVDSPNRLCVPDHFKDRHG